MRREMAASRLPSPAADVTRRSAFGRRTPGRRLRRPSHGGALSVDRLAADLSAVAVAFRMRDIEGREIDPFFNINTKDDLAAARILAAKSQEG